jgi:hypothetical protein
LLSFLCSYRCVFLACSRVNNACRSSPTLWLSLQTLFVSVPLIVILKDVSTNGRYLGSTLLIWTFPMSTITLIMLPKFLAFYKPESATRMGSHLRGTTGGVRVSGMNSAASTDQHSQRFVTKASHQSTDDAEPASVDDMPNLVGRYGLASADDNISHMSTGEGISLSEQVESPAPISTLSVDAAHDTINTV